MENPRESRSKSCDKKSDSNDRRPSLDLAVVQQLVKYWRKKEEQILKYEDKNSKSEFDKSGPIKVYLFIT